MVLLATAQAVLHLRGLLLIPAVDWACVGEAVSDMLTRVQEGELHACALPELQVCARALAGMRVCAVVRACVFLCVMVQFTYQLLVLVLGVPGVCLRAWFMAGSMRGCAANFV